MKLTTTCAWLLTATLIFSSCSIQKRHYRNGFYVDWNHNSEKNASISTTEDPISAITEPPKSIETLSADQPLNTVLLDDIEKNSNASISVMQSMGDAKTSTDDDPIVIGKPKKPVRPEFKGDDSEKKTTNIYACLALIFGSLALFTTLVGAIIFGTAAVVFGIIAIYQIKKNPNQKGKAMAWIGYICGLIAILIWALFI